jgi:hypothetical protein
MSVVNLELSENEDQGLRIDDSAAQEQGYNGM